MHASPGFAHAATLAAISSLSASRGASVSPPVDRRRTRRPAPSAEHAGCCARSCRARAAPSVRTAPARAARDAPRRARPPAAARSRSAPQRITVASVPQHAVHCSQTAARAQRRRRWQACARERACRSRGAPARTAAPEPAAGAGAASGSPRALAAAAATEAARCALAQPQLPDAGGEHGHGAQTERDLTPATTQPSARRECRTRGQRRQIDQA